MNYILAVDIGTTAFKAAVFDNDGYNRGTVTLEYTIDTPHAGWAEMDPSIYLDTFKRAAHMAIDRADLTPEDIDTIGMSCQGETTVYLDESGQPVRPAIVWLDRRAEQEAEDIEKKFGIDSIQQHTGQIGADSIWPGAKLLWLRRHEPEVFGRIGMTVQLKGYISYVLTGRACCEDSILGSSVYYDINKRKYWPEMLDYLGIREDQLPEIVLPGSITGHITPEAAEKFGLSRNTTLSIGGIDLSCGAIGVGNIYPGIFSDSTGSALCVVTVTKKPVLDPNRRMPCYCSAIPGQFMIHAYNMGGMFLRWFRDEFCQEEMETERKTGVNAYDLLDRLAESVEPGCDGLIALPHLQGSGPPDQVSSAKAIFSGITMSHTRAHFVRAIMESVTMVLCRMIEATRDLGIDIDSVISYGGGAKSPVWTQMKADATGLPIRTMMNDDDACCLGAAILAGASSGIWTSIEDGVLTSIENSVTYQPNPANRKAYDDLIAQYKLLMEQMGPVWKQTK